MNASEYKELMTSSCSFVEAQLELRFEQEHEFVVIVIAPDGEVVTGGNLDAGMMVRVLEQLLPQMRAKLGVPTIGGKR